MSPPPPGYSVSAELERAISGVAAAMRADLTPAQLPENIWQLHLACERATRWHHRGTGESGDCSGEGKGRERGASPFPAVSSASLPPPFPLPPYSHTLGGV